MNGLRTSNFVFLATLAGTVLSWSDECEQATGLAPGDALNRMLDDLFSIEASSDARRWSATVDPHLSAALTSGPNAGLPVLIRPTTETLSSMAIRVVQVTVLDARRAAKHSENAAFSTIIERLPCIFYIIDRDGHLRFWNERLAQAVQRGSDELMYASVSEFFDEHGRAEVQRKLRQAFDTGQSHHEAVVVGRDHKRTPFMFQCARMELAGQTFVFGTGVDITERVQNELKLKVYERAMNASFNAIMITRCAGKKNLIEYVNPAFVKLTGFSVEECLDRDPGFMRADDLDVEEHERLHDAIANRISVHSVLRYKRKNGDIFWNELRIDPVFGSDGGATHFVASLSDITEHKQYEERLRHLATHDTLTGLANRSVLHDRLDMAVARALREGTCMATAYLDLDNFKYINDGFGHEAGDLVLSEVANRLLGCVRKGDTVARVGGDEFVLIFNDCRGPDHSAELVERVRTSILQPVYLPGVTVQPGVSIGVSLCPLDGDIPASILRKADAAMYVAKTGGKNRFQFYSRETDTAVHGHLEMEKRLRAAIDQGQLRLSYQPKVDLKSGKVVGAEALVRWEDPERGLLMPDSFIGFAEESGLIIELGEWVLAQSCSTLAELQHTGFPGFSLSVNLSARQLRQAELADKLGVLIKRSEIARGTLELEVTESHLMDNPLQTVAVLQAIKALGLNLSIDDFGTGYSSLSYLQKFPVDFIKIDRSFLGGIERRGADTVIAEAIIALGHSLKMRVVAEGVETLDQIRFLEHHHCDQIQGHYFSAAVTKGELGEMLRSDRRLH